MEPLRILLVDDEEDLVTTLAERLALRGFGVKTATSGSEALEYVSEQDFSVLILDVKMPGVDGLELIPVIRQKSQDLPVIVFSGYGSRADAERAMQEGAVDYLMKPIDIDELIEKITRAAGKTKGRKP